MNADAADCDVLSRRFGQPGALTFKTSELGGPVAELRAAGGTAIVALQGAQVLSWVPAGGGEALWLSPIARLGTGKAVRGGIPICWPWFGPAPPDAVAGSGPWPQHGLVRTRPWDVVHSEADGNHSQIRLSTQIAKDEWPGWPHAAKAMLTADLSDRLAMTLTTENAGQEAIRITGALHTYFRIGDVESVEIGGLDGLEYEDKTLPPGTQNLVKQAGSVRIAGEVDRIYRDHTTPAVIVDHSLGRRIEVVRDGGNSTVVWNPGIEKAIRLGDLDRPYEAGGYRSMLCVETACTNYDAVTLRPGELFTLTAQYRILPL